jgi:hypothetical protein
MILQFLAYNLLIDKKLHNSLAWEILKNQTDNLRRYSMRT